MAGIGRPGNRPGDRAATAAARSAKLHNSAERAVDDPIKLARAARIVRAALARQAITEADLHGPVVQAGDLGGPDAAA